MPGDLWQKFANLRLLYGYMYGHPGKKLLFMGGEIAQWREWNHDRASTGTCSSGATTGGSSQLVGDLNALYRREPALHEVDFEWQGFEWLDCTTGRTACSPSCGGRRTRGRSIVVVCNFTPVVREDYRIGVPAGGYYRELLNTDAELLRRHRRRQRRRAS